MSMVREIIFESLEHYQLFCTLFPEEKGSARWAAEMMVGSPLCLDQENKNRMTILNQFLSSKEQTEATKWLTTLEQLRLSLIVTHEQVDFCFSLLYPSPKNIRLQQLLHLYLDSPLRNDLAELYWRSIGFLKEHPNRSEANQKCFVKSRSSTYLFAEWARSHQSLQSDSVEPIEFWELPISNLESTGPSLSPIMAPPTQMLSFLAQRLADIQATSLQWVAFGGSPQALLFLESKLKSLKVSFRSLFHEPWSDESSPKVVLAPFQAVPLKSHLTYWSYIDESFFSAKESLCLTENELFTLMNGGFNIPRISTDRTYLKSMLEEMQKPGRQPLFLSNQVPNRDFVQLEELPVTPRSRLPIPELNLPPKKIKLSATQVESYANCPAQYLIRHRLKLRPHQPLEDRYALIFGMAVHSCLENHFKNPAQNLQTQFLTVLDSLSPELKSEPLLYESMISQFQQVETHFLNLEKELTQEFGVKSNVALEKSFEMDIEGFQFSGKMDRITQRNDGSLLLIDYKTGRVTFSPNHIILSKHFQALLYFISLKTIDHAPCSGVLFYDLKEGELRRGLFREDLISKELKQKLTRGHTLSPDAFQSLIDQGQRHLIQIATAIQEGLFPAKPNPEECSRCEAVTFCRQGAGYV